MDDKEWLGIRLNYWDDTAWAFEPAKIVRQLRKAFPEAEVDPIDHQQARLQRELEAWSQGVPDPDQRATMSRQSWSLYKTNGPTYRFVISFPSGDRVNGQARRLSVGFWVPRNLPGEFLEQLLAFLRSLQMGDPQSLEEELDG